MSDSVVRTGAGLAAWRSYQGWRNVQQAQVRDIMANVNYGASQIRTANVVLANALAQVEAAQAVAATRADLFPQSYYLNKLV